jgi:hypothetical protein
LEPLQGFLKHAELPVNKAETVGDDGHPESRFAEKFRTTDRGNVAERLSLVVIRVRDQEDWPVACRVPPMGCSFIGKDILRQAVGTSHIARNAEADSCS